MSYTKQDFQSLKIRAYLRRPVISDQYLPLDSVLFNHFIRFNFGRQTVSLPRSGEHAVWSGKYLPLLKRNDQSEWEWYYACSFAQWDEATVIRKDFFVKQLETKEIARFVDFKGKRGKIWITRGEDKAYMVQDYVRVARHIDWYCRGIKSELELLLPFCTHLGKHTAKGWGAVMKWEIEETDKDWYKNDDTGKLMRAIPSEKGNAVYGIRPSYWHPRHQFPCIMPG